MFSLSCSVGGLPTIASYNKPKANIYYNAIVVVIADTLTSIMAGFALFSFLGYTANLLEKKDGLHGAEKYLKFAPTQMRGPKVALIGMPFAMSNIRASPEFFNALVFFMFVLFAFGTQYVGLEVVFTAIDQIKVGK